ncbi:MAG: hypothetical protein ABF649_22360 [Bacillus sp. (in: firmicutes)]
MNYYFGFSWMGLIIFLLPMLPNLIYFFIPPSDESGNKANSHSFLDFLEHGSQGIFIFLLIFNKSTQVSEIISTYTIAIVILLIFYYMLWIFYFTGNKNLVVLLGMAIIPVVYFVLAEIWLHQYMAIIPTLFFGSIHLIITCKDY